MDPRRVVLKAGGVWLVLGGLVTLLSPMYLIYMEAVDTILGILVTLALILLATYEMSAGRTTFKVEEGGDPGIIRSFFFTYVARAALLILTTGDLFYINLVFLLGEVGVMVFVLKNREMFMPSEEVREATMKKISGPKMISVAECPRCHEVVETTWESCPYCGTELPRLCAGCGEPLGIGMATCPNCGAEVVREEALDTTIRSLTELAEEETQAPENRSSSYAKLAEALLKGGRVAEAHDAYARAIDHTQFNRKKCLFMVKMARLLENSGKREKALEILDRAMGLDPDDYAGARKMREEILGQEAPGGGGVSPRPA